MERRKTPIFPGCIILPLTWYFICLWFMPILDFFAERPQGFHSWDIKNILLINSDNTDYQFRELAWYGKAYVQLLFAMVGGFFSLIFHFIFRNS
jgi:hypothetical protein